MKPYNTDIIDLAIKNYFALPIKSPAGVATATGIDTSPRALITNLSNYISPVQLQRTRQDVGKWRASMSEAEMAWYPQRVRMQQMFMDTRLNGHVYACMERRKDLTLLRKFEFVTGEGDAAVMDKAQTEWFSKQKWFKDFLNYALDSLFYGYSLIALGDIEKDNFKKVSLVRRWNVSPDRRIVGHNIYAVAGKSWDDDDVKNFHVYVDTPSDHGNTPCGYGLLYTVGLYEIFLRNILGYNGDFVELYSQPYRIAKTNKTEEAERAELEAAMQNLGSSGYAIIDPSDEITFLETALAGTGWKGYENFEQRLQKLISKVILGHADAMDSVPGKLGAGQDGEESPTAQALSDKQVKDGEFITPIINEMLLEKMRALGFALPEGLTFRFKNDDEIAATRKKEDESNAITAGIAQTMKNAGLKMEAAYFTKRTGIPAAEIEEPEPVLPGVKPGDAKKLRNLLEDFYI